MRLYDRRRFTQRRKELTQRRKEDKEKAERMYLFQVVDDAGDFILDIVDVEVDE
jgi:hypothetical protein